MSRGPEHDARGEDGRGEDRRNEDRRGEDGFLSRWSRRKRSAEDAPAATGPAGAPVAPAGIADREPQPPAAPERTDAEVLAELGLKDPDALEPGDDFAGFMARAVPDHLRRRALRRLWRSNPVLANLDGLNDYDADFTGDTVAPGMLKTAYQVGRGFVTGTAAPDEAADAGEAAEVAAEVAAGEAADRQASLSETEAAAGGADAHPAQPTDSIGNQTAGPEAGSGPETPPPDAAPGPGRRRMRFRFET